MGLKTSLTRRKVAAGVGTGIVALGLWASQAVYTVREVVDGDTFITKENIAVRLDSVNAPEKNLCLGEEAKAELEKLVLNKKVFIKVTYVDGYKRLVGSVFTLKGNVGRAMLSKGLTTFQTKGNQDQKNLLQYSQEIRNKKLGVYSDKCTQTENPKNKECNIKGNTNSDFTVYRHPGCKYYKTTIVQLHFGDKWFCSELSAVNAGFNKAADCP
jgi:micrococcal nuclease